MRFATRYGFDLTIDPGAGSLERFLYDTGIYEAGTLELMRDVLRPGDVFLDVGANIGLMTLTAALRVGERGHVYAFEPEAGACALLRGNVSMNGLTNVTVVESALGASAGTATIHERETLGRGSATLVEDREQHSAGSEVTIDAIDRFHASIHFQPLRMVKIDVEGWEYQVLKGGESLFSSPEAPIVCIECSRLHPLEGGTVREMLDWLTGVKAYILFTLRGGKNVPSPLVRVGNEGLRSNHDNVFCFLERHIRELPATMFEGTHASGGA